MFLIINASQHGWLCGYFAVIIIINIKLDKSGNNPEHEPEDSHRSSFLFTMH